MIIYWKNFNAQFGKGLLHADHFSVDRCPCLTGLSPWKTVGLVQSLCSGKSLSTFSLLCSLLMACFSALGTVERCPWEQKLTYCQRLLTASPVVHAYVHSPLREASLLESRQPPTQCLDRLVLTSGIFSLILLQANKISIIIIKVKTQMKTMRLRWAR